ncbi:MAG: membrane protein insertion efficiency factor YidD [SAR116 cluster bacterium]|nr:membrane protein insertion efficiency factor YidD [SAR116 cluster bacterium]RPH09921.1 MAG: membrane protein insertion efficiency factor YidD [Alphaproteobacteria bacterium TMED54]|tara:strand:- start:1257 stop:1493 length:237 start_codon:yes stop_codon:yes gene_type:complete
MIFTLKKCLKLIILYLIKGYKILISPYIGTNCRFLPTCSDYAHEAIMNKGIVKGGFLAIKRLIKCHPWGKSGYDPVNK